MNHTREPWVAEKTLQGRDSSISKQEKNMREILFRGKRVDNGEWVEGSLVNNTYDSVPYIINPDEYEEYWCVEDLGELAVEVIGDTVGQYIGQKDKNGKKIFEGDILKGTYDSHKYVVKINEYYVYTVDERGEQSVLGHIKNYFEIVGNIHDNPELLGG
jgi:uncharacterized phage protein (TIGR01671 family)